MPAPRPDDQAKARQAPLKHKESFRKCLIQWFETEGKSYPWRETTDPWAILVSEIMLQQTQIASVLGKGHYSRFMALYPTPASMAGASEQEILKAWEGLGYYRRARNLHAAARAITAEHAGHFPTQYEFILELPGIGRYTAGAVASFAYNSPHAIVDANVARVFSRLFNYRERIDTSAGNKQLWQWADTLVDPDNPRAYNSALMELGQSYCSNKSPDCLQCPVRTFCHCPDPANLPVKKSATPTTRIDEFALFSRDNHGRILLQQEAEGKRRAGMWHLPRRQQDAVADLPLRLKTTYSITRYQVTLHLHSSHPDHTRPQANEQWHSIQELENLPMPSPDRRALLSVLEQD